MCPLFMFQIGSTVFFYVTTCDLVPSAYYFMQIDDYLW